MPNPMYDPRKLAITARPPTPTTVITSPRGATGVIRGVEPGIPSTQPRPTFIPTQQWKQQEEAKGSNVVLISTELAKKINYTPPSNLYTQQGTVWISIPPDQPELNKYLYSYEHAKLYATQMVDAADKGDPLSRIFAKVGEAGQETLGFAFINRWIDQIQGNDTRENRINRITEAIQSEILSKGDFLKAARLYMSSVAGVVGTSAVMGGGAGILWKVPILRAPLAGLGGYSAVQTYQEGSKLVGTPGFAPFLASTATSFIAGTLGFKKGVIASTVSGYKPVSFKPTEFMKQIVQAPKETFAFARAQITKRPISTLQKLSSYDILGKTTSFIGGKVQPLKERYYKAVGMKEVPLAKYIEAPERLYGKPSTPTKAFKDFWRTKEWLHATERRWGEAGELAGVGKVPKGPRAAEPGVSISPGGKAETAFFRIGKEVPSYPRTPESVRISILPKLGRPTLYKGRVGLKPGEIAIKLKPSLTEPSIAMKMFRGGREAEAKIPSGTRFTIAKAKEYFTFKEHKIPVFETKMYVRRGKVSDVFTGKGKKITIPGEQAKEIQANLQAQKTYINDLTRMLSKSAKAEIIAEKQITGRVKYSFKDISKVFSEAFEMGKKRITTRRLPSETDFYSPPYYSSIPMAGISMGISAPSYKGGISRPSDISKPSKPSYPSLVSLPSYDLSRPSRPSKPSYPSFPSAPSYPSEPSKPSYPITPSYPYSKPSRRTYPTPPVTRAPSEQKVPGKKEELKPGYNVYVKKKATKPTRAWVKVNKEPMTRSEAAGKGAENAKNTASRTFKLKPTNKKVKTKFQRYSQYWDQVQHQFYLKKGTSNIYIQKTQYSISTIGEKQEIPWAPRAPKIKPIANVAARKTSMSSIRTQKQFTFKPNQGKQYKFKQVKL